MPRQNPDSHASRRKASLAAPSHGQAEAPGSGARRAAPQALQHPYRAELRRLDPAFYPVPWQTAPVADGQSRSIRLSYPLGRAARRGGVHSEPALSAILFLYRDVLEQELEWIEGFERAKRPARLPVVLTPAETRAVLAQLEGTKWLMASLLYGSGLRLMECLRLRVKDVDFGYGQILVRDGKGAKDRVTMLPQALIEPLKAHLEKVR